ncbi:MAG: DapH/DapD/GlmU-related protein [Xenococcaceae cyanobacterium]
MTEPENSKSMKSIYILGFPINIAIEMLIQLISLFVPTALFTKSLATANLLIITLALLISLYIYSLSILFLSAVVTRLLPKPTLGIIKTPSDEFKYQTLIALNTFVRRTPARWLMNIPFPGSLFYKICGTKIDSSALVTFSDSLPDPYLISIGKNSVLGWGCLVLGHYAPTPSTLFLGKVNIGNNVLIGAEAMVWPNVKIGDNSIVQNKAVVVPGTIIPPNEVWGGVPARKIKSIKTKNNSTQIPSLEPEKIEEYIQELLVNKYNIQSVDKDAALLSLGLTAEDINRILKTIEKRYNIFIDRTEIDITTFSFNNLLKTIQK